MLRYEDISKRWNVNVSFVRNLVYSGKLKRMKLGHRRVRFRLSDIEEYEKKAMK